MSRGLGRSQLLVLRALLSLEKEAGAQGAFYVWVIVNKAYDISPAHREREAAGATALKLRNDAIRERAKAGDPLAAAYLALGSSLASSRRYQGRPVQRAAPWRLMEVRFNPSRVLAELQKRGLVHRRYGLAGLTDAGRQLAISVGQSLRHQGEGGK